MKSKKAQLGKIISTIPVLILLIILMGIFIVLAGYASLWSHNSNQEFTPLTLDNPLLIKLEGRTLVHALMKVNLEKNVKMPGVKKELLEYLSEKYKNTKGEFCFILCQTCGDEFRDVYDRYSNKESGNIFFRFVDGRFIGVLEELNSVPKLNVAETSTTELNLYSRAGLSSASKFRLEEKEIKIVYYEGRCYGKNELLKIIEEGGR